MGTTAVTVFVVHELTNATVRDNLAPALKFGAIRYVNRFYIHGDELERDGFDDNIIPRGYLANMERAAAEFNPIDDYLLIVGDHLQLLALTAILIGRFGSISVLRHDRQLNEYIPVRLYSGLVPPGQRVLTSGTDIGEDDGENRNQGPTHVGIDPGKGDDATAFWPDTGNLETLSADDRKIRRSRPKRPA